MSRVRFHVLGGFLGAGKTTAMLRLAARFRAEGLRVGLVTNDQAADLVDTGAARAAGFPVEEVAGACFCCKFDDLARLATKLCDSTRPDVLIGEPVGSCTDLAATVIRPLSRLFGDRFDVAPYTVLVDPARARQVLLDRGFAGFSRDVAYLFRKQLEEADVVALNKRDLLAPAELRELLAALAAAFPRARVVAISGETGEGFDEWRAAQELVARRGVAGANVAEVDYDRYAAGEAELGWLNLAAELAAPEPFAADALALAIVEALRSELAGRGEIAHAKVLVAAAGAVAIANHVGHASATRLSRAADVAATRARIVLNARVHLDPQLLRAAAERALAEVAARRSATLAPAGHAAFRPGRPIPLHRDAG